MGYRKKENWTLEQWIAYGNRVKRLREEIDKYKSAMEDIAAKTVRDTHVTKIFYGDVFPENRPEEKGNV